MERAEGAAGAEALDLGDPGLRVPVVLVVAGAEVDAVGRRQLPEGRDVVPEVVHVAVHEVPGDGDQIRLELVGHADAGGEVGTADRRADVDVAEDRVVVVFIVIVLLLWVRQGCCCWRAPVCSVTQLSV